ncbi:MAG TPA: hypothetical protein ENL06_03075, partial [Candidatus Portnoybacteria bacterium]|nr:hypothetical protein [Candidatus Portnoybacteria bacterium]
EDFKVVNEEEGQYLEIYTAPAEVDQVRKFLEEQGVKIDSFSLAWLPQNEIDVADEERGKVERLIDELTDYQDVNEVYSNLKDF